MPCAFGLRVDRLVVGVSRASTFFLFRCSSSFSFCSATFFGTAAMPCESFLPRTPLPFALPSVSVPVNMRATP
jgi:hypothetical protein